MFCLVDFRNRPQLQYTFSDAGQAREHIRKIKNNSLGITAIYPDGRREYFENGLPRGFFQSSDRNVKIQKGCHVKYAVQKLNALDGLVRQNGPEKAGNFSSWRKKSSFPLFMLGNRKIYTALAVVSIFIFSSSFYFQNRFGSEAFAGPDESGKIEGRVAGATDAKIEAGESENSLKLADEDVIASLLGKIEDAKAEEFEAEIAKYIKGRPMEKMAPYIAREDRIVAAFLIGIAMKESKFGVYAPHSGGRDCYNYWGYRGRENTTASGYSCFNSPEHAVQVVGKKISSLVNRGISNPAEMISWKCGSTCAGHGAENVRKWIADVGVNFYKINSKENS